MPEYVVTTWETVEGTYVVTADSEEAAAYRVGGILTAPDWEGVEQREYIAFDVDVRKVEPA